MSLKDIRTSYWKEWGHRYLQKHFCRKKNFSLMKCCQLSYLPIVYFSASESFDSTYPTNVVVTSSGLCTYIPPGIFKSSCPIDITWFPFDDQNCEMKFGSWTYNGFKVIVVSYKQTIEAKKGLKV